MKFYRRGSLLVWFALTSVSLGQSTGQFNEQYDQLASSVSDPASLEPENGSKQFTDPAVMLRLEKARQQVLGMRAIASELDAAHKSTLAALENCHSSLESIRQLNGYTPDFEGLISSGITASPGVYKVYKQSRDKNAPALNSDDVDSLTRLGGKAVSEIWNYGANQRALSDEKQNYRDMYRAARKAAYNGLAPIAKSRYSTVPQASKICLALSIDSSCGNYFDSDDLLLRNVSGQNLTACTLFVEVGGPNISTGANEFDHHVHFIANWPADKTVRLKYPSRSASGMATNQSTDVIRSINIWLFSNEIWEKREYEYGQEEYDKNIERVYLSTLRPTFKGEWLDSNIFRNSRFSVSFDSKDSNYFPPCILDLTLKEGRDTITRRWRCSYCNWERGEDWALSDQAFNDWNPREIELTISFPQSNYQQSLVWNR